MAMSMTIEERPGRGRCVIATRPIKAGEIILRESPFLVYPSQTHSQTQLFCCHCFRAILPSAAVSLQTCPSCNLFFCSIECRSKSLYSTHTQWVCTAMNMLNSFLNSGSDSEMKSQACFLIAAYNLWMVDQAKFQLLLSLHGHGRVDSQVQILHSFVAKALSTSQIGIVIPGFSEEMSAAFLAKDKQNAFGLMAPLGENGQREIRAYALYRLASFFNHDCLPNACRFEYLDKPGDNNTDIIIRSLHDIQEGSEICISYFPVNWQYFERQKRLSEDYGFVCRCDRCNVEEAWSDNESMDEEAGSGSGMEEDEDPLQTAEQNADQERDDFPHAYFFVRYLCPVDNCGGTMAPLPPTSGNPSSTMECNMCGYLRSEEEFNSDVREHCMDD
eukprot:TRINITY_DN9003_c0_g1_i1.p1 TRINITY_DN9003_c0_g1~~TRINITY_DN9003_c0_g1_i1.p1  ORF type:complete len:427 (-),score=76.21 TRINITY_DN9003_c0_g1_i1:240-1400(-)